MASLRSLDAAERRVLLPPVLPDSVEIPVGGAHRLTGAIFATGWQVDVVRDGGGDAARDGVWLAALRARIEVVLESIDAQMSPWREASALMRFNRAGEGERVLVPEPMRAVIDGAIGIANLTGGAFDPTLHDAVALWGFGATAVPGGLPEADALAAMEGRRLDWRALTWDDDALIARDGLTLDLCGIAKGYAVDAVMDVIRATPGAAAALVEIGGELKGWNLRPDGMPWWVEIERPESAVDAPFMAALCDWSVATSGDYRRSFRHGDADYCHALDPRTLAPVQTGVASATVFDPLCWRADALATALMVLGRDDALAFADAHAIPCILTVREGNGLTDHLSAAMRAWLDDDD